MAKKLNQFKRTKILATIGPATNSREAIQELVDSGANGFRLNFSHGSDQERRQQIAWVRSVAKAKKLPIAILQDLQGPKIRLGDLPQPQHVHDGDTLNLVHNGDVSKGEIPVQYDLTTKVKKGERLYIFDGKIRTEITKVSDDQVTVEVKHGGLLMSRKGINLPDTNLAGDIITDKDKEDIRFGADADIDYVALSFVQSADDIEQLRKRLNKLGSTARVIAKIETGLAVENIEEIIKVSDGVMVARGDLAIETEPESVPVVQRQIIGLAQKYSKLCIVATQMLASMVEMPEPTRAEVSDVATAVILGTDCVMLSDETANGEFPAETVKFMEKIVLYTQENSPVAPLFFHEEDHSVSSAVSSAVMTLAHQVEAKAIVAETASGQTARSLAAHRPAMPIIMITDNQRVANQLSLIYGGKSYVRPRSRSAAEKMTEWLHAHKILKKDDLVVITQGKYPGEIGGTDTIRVRKV
jgi:pyruvate kinase